MIDGKVFKDVLHYDGESFKEESVALVREAPFTIYLNDREFITLLCYPDNLDELAAGFLKSEGLIEKAGNIIKIKVSKDKSTANIYADVQSIDEKLHEKRIVTTGCGKGSVFYFALDSLKCRPQEIKKKWRYDDLLSKMKETSQTRGSQNLRGLHVCGLYDGKNLIIREDIGRHNALDKIIGHCVLNNNNTDDCVIFTTGRISSEILLKASKVKAGMVVSRSTPTDMAMDIAEKLNITLVGYVRGNIMTVYTAKERIIK